MGVRDPVAMPDAQRPLPNVDCVLHRAFGIEH
jgi:hypothetical protein